MALVKLHKEDFCLHEKEVVCTKDLKVITKKYPTGVESLIVKNSRGHVEILPFMGQMIWDLVFDCKSLKLTNMFDMPRPAKTILDTYGCFAFHSGILANGCPGPEDNHPMHGEFSVAPMDEVVLDVADDVIKVISKFEYCQGFGFHYAAAPSVSLGSNDTFINIDMEVKNLTHARMPLQYMCHLNYAFIHDAVLSSNIPDNAFDLRESIPSHVHPTPEWHSFIERLKQNQLNGNYFNKLDDPKYYDPEIVFLSKKLTQYDDNAVYEMTSPNGQVYFTEFATSDFPYATRWIMYNQDLQVAAFVLPATCHPEGYAAAARNSTLIFLEHNEVRNFQVKTGLRG